MRNYHEFKIRKRDNPEGRTQLAILKYLRGKGYCIGKTKTMGTFGGKSFRLDPYTFLGFPDLTCFTHKELVFIEVKSKSGIQSPFQLQFEEQCKKVGIRYILARSIEDVESI